MSTASIIGAGVSGSGANAAGPSVLTLLQPTAAESKRDRKRRETINKIEVLHDESWRNRDERFSQLYRDYHNENKTVNVQPPTSTQYLLRLYPKTLERDALLEAMEVEYQSKVDQGRMAYEGERAQIEAQYWEARDQVRQRLLGAIEERRRKLREEKEGGDVITETLLEAQNKPRPKRRMPFKNRIPAPIPNILDTVSDPTIPPPSDASARPQMNGSTVKVNGNGIGSTTNGILPSSSPNGTASSTIPQNDLLMHSHLAPALTRIDITDILSPSCNSLILVPPAQPLVQPSGKRGPRGKDNTTGKGEETLPAPGTLTALAIASGQQAPRNTAASTGRNAGASTHWVIGKSLAELKKMESASQMEQEADWARIQGPGGRGRRARGD